MPTWADDLLRTVIPLMGSRYLRPLIADLLSDTADKVKETDPKADDAALRTVTDILGSGASRINQRND